MAEVAVIAHTKTNLLDSVLKSCVSSGIAKNHNNEYMNLARGIDSINLDRKC